MNSRYTENEHIEVRNPRAHHIRLRPMLPVPERILAAANVYFSLCKGGMWRRRLAHGLRRCLCQSSCSRSGKESSWTQHCSPRATTLQQVHRRHLDKIPLYCWLLFPRHNMYLRQRARMDHCLMMILALLLRWVETLHCSGKGAARRTALRLNVPETTGCKSGSKL